MFEIDFRLAQKERQFQDALLVASAVRLEALADDGVVTPGQAVNISAYATPGHGAAPRRHVSGFDGAPPTCTGIARPGDHLQGAVKIPANAHLSTPYWTPRQDAARYDFEPGRPIRRAVPPVAVPRDVRRSRSAAKPSPSSASSSIATATSWRGRSDPS